MLTLFNSSRIDSMKYAWFSYYCIGSYHLHCMRHCARRPTAGDHWGLQQPQFDTGYATTNTDGELGGLDRESKVEPDSRPQAPQLFQQRRWRGGYNPDIIFATNRIAGYCNKIVMEPKPRSQHRPIGVQVNAAITVQTVPFRRRFNLKKANWEQYAYQHDAAVDNIPATAECYDQFVNALRKVA